MNDRQLSEEQALQLGLLVDVYPEARELGELFMAHGHELYLVGGTVRDTLLAGDAKHLLDTIDLDFATSATPEQCEELLRGWADAVWTTGIAFGTVSCEHTNRGGLPRKIEITTFRADTYASGSRHPTVTYGESIDEDLGRRDLTVNAMAVAVPHFRFVDPYGGLNDLHARRLRTPIDPRQSFGDDPLRMVRLARFAAVLDAEPDTDTLTAATQMCDQLASISAERIRDELVKLMLGTAPVRGLSLLLDTGLSAYVLPELDGLKDCHDPLHRHKDVLAHTFAVVENAIAREPDGPDFVLRFAALMHDVGKPDTKELVGDGSVTFHHHDVVGARMTRQRMRALKFDKETIKDVSELVRMHLRFHTFKHGWTDAAVRRYVRDAGHLYQQLNLLTRADVTTGNARRADAIQRNVDALEERVEELKQQEELDALRPALDGNQVMRHLGIGPGPLVGEAWQFLLELRIEQGDVAPDVALAALDQWWASRQENA